MGTMVSCLGESEVDAEDETALTELEIMPDGRIFVFGASGQILEILNQLQSPQDPTITSRLCKEADPSSEIARDAEHKRPTESVNRDCNSDILE